MKRRPATITNRFYSTNPLEYKALHWWWQCPLCRTGHGKEDLVGDAAIALARHVAENHNDHVLTTNQGVLFS